MPDPLLSALYARLQPGDILLFDRPGLFGTLIKLKRGEQYSHVEIYAGDGQTVASRNGIGVNQYPIDLNGLAAIYRPTNPAAFSFQKGMEWFTSKDSNGKFLIKGQGYDWIGLLSFTFAKFQGRNSGKMFCSEFVMRFYRHAGLELFSPITDADAVSPGMLPYSLELKPLWLRADKRTKHED